MSIEQTCVISGQKFIVTDDDLKFYEKMGVPVPTLCPLERSRRRCVWRNERGLYWRQCSATDKKILSMYSPDVAFPVYSNEYWWSDNWDPLDYSRDFNFDRPFFEQFKELLDVVPVMSRDTLAGEGVDYCNQTGYMKNSYWCFDADESEQCLYSSQVLRCYDCIDCLYVTGCEGCYDCSDCDNCSFSRHLFESKNCDECHFSKGLIGCSYCFGCTNLRNKQYCFLNDQLTKKDYEEKIASIFTSNTYQELVDSFGDFQKKIPVRYRSGLMNDNSTGNFLYECKNCKECYDCQSLENCSYCYGVKKGPTPTYNCYDVHTFGMTLTNCYECVTCGFGVNNILFSNAVWNGGSDMAYCHVCVNDCSDCFGCVGLRKQKYCILNKQYTKKEYFELKAKIIAHMKETSEWGEFFPAPLCPFPYNDTIAEESHPISESEAISFGYTWRDKTVKSKYEGSGFDFSDNIDEVGDDILQSVLLCEKTQKPYRITRAELKFYRKMNLPIPRLHPDERHNLRIALRNPRQLWDRQCDECNKEIQTTYNPDRPEKVLCEECYLNVVN